MVAWRDFLLSAGRGTLLGVGLLAFAGGLALGLALVAVLPNAVFDPTAAVGTYPTFGWIGAWFLGAVLLIYGGLFASLGAEELRSSIRRWRDGDSGGEQP